MLERTASMVHACPACGHATAQRLLYEKNGCAVMRCTECGLGRTDASGFDPSTYYTEHYFSGGHSDGYADYRAAEPTLRREFEHVVRFIRRYKPAGRLLEIGCAYGFFLQEARAYFEVQGIEIAADAAAYARQQGLEVRPGIADADTLAPLGTFDVIVLLDVIEHLPDPAGTVALIAEHLAPGGIVVMTTGDFASPLARLTGVRWRLMTPPQHLWFFTPESMRRLARAQRLQVERVDHPWKTVPLSLILFQLGRMVGLHASAPALGRVGLPVNLFDAMRVVMRKAAA
jgi:SAM-dependent methyltransferase